MPRSLCDSRDSFAAGEYWLLNTRYNVVSEKYVDLDTLAKEYGALADSEELEEPR
jgi:hypothetical protein